MPLAGPVIWAEVGCNLQDEFWIWKQQMLALAGQPSLHGSDACMVYWNKGALRRNCRQKYGKTQGFFCLVGIQGSVFWEVLSSGIYGLVEPSTLGRSPSSQVGVEVFDVGGWLTHGDLALEAKVDFLAVVEHRLIPARVGSEWARLRKRGLASIWALACQDSSHVGNAGVGVINMRGAPVALLLLPLPCLRGSLIAVGRLGVCSLLMLGGSCNWLSCMVIRALILI